MSGKKSSRPTQDERATLNELIDVPASVVRMLRRGGTAALVCAAASSFVALFQLAVLVGWIVWIAWLLPASLDVYAGTSLYVGYRLPAEHPAAKAARRNARFALSLTIGCNAIYHALILFGAALPVWVHDSLLVAVSALPPIVVERVLHLSSKVGNGNPQPVAPAVAAIAPVAAPATPTATAVAVARTPAATPKPVAAALPGARAALLPVAPPATPPRHTVNLGNAPTQQITVAEKEEIVRNLLAQHGDELDLTAIAAALGTKHRSTAKRVRDRVIEQRGPAPAPTEGAAEEPEPALAVAS